MITADEANARIRKRLARAVEHLAAWNARHTHAIDRLQWIGSIVESAVTESVCTEVLGALDAGRTVEGVHEYAANRGRTLGKFGAQKSTAPLDASIHAETIRAWFEIVDVLEGNA